MFPTDWQPEIPATLLFIVKDGKILLIEKKRGHGAGKINGPGGKIDPGETPLESIVRETREELCITPVRPEKIGELAFAMSDYPSILCHVFRAEDFSGTPTETDEAIPVWYPVDAIPYERMWEDDRYWLPLLIRNEPFLGRFTFSGETMLWNEIVTDISWGEKRE
ncbi:MAG: 8-oxo-dGTP diphosphatase [Luteolibacter sp.]